MVCRACGRIIANENANFCEYCGTSVDGRDGKMNFDRAQEGWQDQRYRSGQQGGYGGGYGDSYGGYGEHRTTTADGLVGILSGTAGTAEAEPSMSFVHWFAVLVLPYIPFIGGFAYLILLFVWSFGRTASTTRKNWARASLVVMVITLILVASMLPSIMQILSEGGMESLLGV